MRYLSGGWRRRIGCESPVAFVRFTHLSARHEGMVLTWRDVSEDMLRLDH